jgi:NDP-sugar pyrophosphorylase family protein
MKAVIQSGGKGMRLRPYTNILPKPLMPVGSKPVIEMLLRWLRRNGVQHVYITTGYLGHLIRSFCGDGGRWNLKIEYTEESEPRGTIGALSLLREELDGTFLIINGDVLTDLNLNGFAAYHRKHGGALTVAVSRRTVRVDFGVLEQVDSKVVAFREKPNLTSLVSMGIYCMEPGMLQHIPDGIPFGFDDLMFSMLEKGQLVHTFLHDGFWLDVGRVEDFQKAQTLEWDEDAPAFDMSPLSLETSSLV